VLPALKIRAVDQQNCCRARTPEGCWDRNGSQDAAAVLVAALVMTRALKQPHMPAAVVNPTARMTIMLPSWACQPVMSTSEAIVARPSHTEATAAAVIGTVIQ
jgi:hypothetical protein